MKDQDHPDPPTSESRDAAPSFPPLLNRMAIVGVATVGLFLIAVLYSLSVASAFFIPLIVAFLLDLLLSPIVRSGSKLGLSPPLVAGAIIIALLGALGVGTYYLADPAMEWLETAPRKLKIAEYKLRGLTEPLEKMRKAAKEVDEATSGNNGQQKIQVEQEASMGTVLMNQTQSFISGLLITIFLLYFLLASGDMMIRKIVRILPQFHQQKNAVRIIRSIESDLSRYLGMICLINFGLGVAVTGAMYLIGMPNPLLWGALAGLLNFVPYLGPVVNITIVGLVALVSFEQVGYALLAPLAYLFLNGIEASLVTPAVMGWHLRLNPVAIFIALTFWTWVWGIPGSLLAVPILASTKITCDHIQFLHPVGELLGQ